MSDSWFVKKRAVAVVGALVFVLAGCSDDPEPAQAQPEKQAAETRTITVGASVVGQGAQVTWSCVEDGKVSTCGPETLEGVWTEKVDVPVGETVRVQAEGGQSGASCWITDEEDQVEFARDDHGRCEWVVE